jgi:hypothetical protein
MHTGLVFETGKKDQTPVFCCGRRVSPFPKNGNKKAELKKESTWTEV